ncbi:MAG: chloride channel protein [Deltaproteobacteria bacterium]|nr:chloride channel protein [Myxococcales bacterium]MDP3219795.1 chloride channel protein [Deltaproteobacteria bacterium]
MEPPLPSPDDGPLLSAVRRAGAPLNRLLLRVIERATLSEQNRLLGLTIAVGVACGLAAVGFHLFIRLVETTFFARVAAASGTTRSVGLVVVPMLGALVAGVALDRLAPEARGSGIPQVKWVYGARRGRLRSRDGAAKFILAALQIGTGSSLGREGPTVQICATVASALGRVFALSPSNQRRLIPVGAAAGIAAAFNAPIAAVTFVIEELVGGLDTTVLSGVVVAAALSAAVEHSILGERPVLAVPAAYGLTHASSLLVFALLGLAAGLLGHAFSSSLLRVRQGFRDLKRIPPWARPALGGALTGLIALAALELVGTLGVAGGGYEVLAQGLRGSLPLKVMAVLCVAKFAATIASYSSGGAGGIFAPTLFVGAMLGGLMGEVDRHLLGHADVQLGAFALVGMGAFFAAVVRAPMTSILIVFEMTGSYKLVLPLMVANAVAYVTARARSATPIYDALLEQDGRHMPQAHLASPALTAHRVGDTMRADPVALAATDTIDAAVATLAPLPFETIPVVGDDRVLVGVVTEARLRRLQAEGRGAELVSDHARLRGSLVPGNSLRSALVAMNRLEVRLMMVVDDPQSRRLVGVISTSDVVGVLLRFEEASEPRSSRTGEHSALTTNPGG